MFWQFVNVQQHLRLSVKLQSLSVQINTGQQNVVSFTFIVTYNKV